MERVAHTLCSHRELIVNWFKANKRFSSGVVEGLKNKAKLTMRKSYGFRSTEILAMDLYHALMKLPEPEPAYEFYRRVFYFNNIKVDIKIWRKPSCYLHS